MISHGRNTNRFQQIAADYLYQSGQMLLLNAKSSFPLLLAPEFEISFEEIHLPPSQLSSSEVKNSSLVLGQRKRIEMREVEQQDHLHHCVLQRPSTVPNAKLIPQFYLILTHEHQNTQTTIISSS